MAAGKPADSKAVRAAIDAGRVPKVWVWAGPEQFLKDDLFGRLAAKLVDEASTAFNVDRFRCGQDDLDSVLGTVNTFPMLGAHRVVLLADVDKLGRKERDRLVAHIPGSAPEAALVLTLDRGPRDSLVTRLAKAGAETAVFWTPFPDQTRQWIQIRFRDLGKTCDTETALALLDRCGGGMGAQVPLREVAPEIEKVALSIGDRAEVRESDLRVVAHRPGEDLLRRVCAHAAAGDAPQALRALDGALRFKENEPPRILWYLANYLEKATTAAQLAEEGMPSQQIQRSLGVFRAGDWKDLGAAARRMRGPRGPRCLILVAEADRTLKSSSLDSRILLEATLHRICR